MSSDRQCRGTNAEGEPCQSDFVGEDGWCDAHRPGNEDTMSERGRQGGIESGRTRRRQENLLPDELPELEDLDTAKQWLDTLGRAVATGRIERREADPAIRAVQAWVATHSESLAAEQLETLAERVEQLEQEKARGSLSRRAG